MTGFIIDEDFDYFYNDKGFGPPIYSEDVTDDIIKKFHEKLPNKLLEYWKVFGFSGWGNGLYWLVNPDDYQDVLDAWLDKLETPPHEEYYVIARTAFGDLDIWGTIHGNCLTISSSTSQIFPKFESINREDWDRLLATLIVTRNKSILDIDDWKNKPLFERAIKKYGPLNQHEMFGFEPALVLGGEAKLENVRKLPIISHLQLFASLDTPRLMLDIGQYVDEQVLGQED